ncbi:MAG TPA: flagellar motor switch protein FliN [Phycisphaerales bacterium]|nr:flagellar motor switch protein FliN [Phycisphaerales bacterium]
MADEEIMPNAGGDTPEPGAPSEGDAGGPAAHEPDAIGPEDAAAMASAMLDKVHAAVSDAGAGAKPPPEGSIPLDLPTFESGAESAAPADLDLLADVNLDVKIELGRTRMLVEDVLKLSDGAVVELDKLAGDPVDIYVNERHVARGEVLVLNDNFCVRINEIVDPDERRAG